MESRKHLILLFVLFSFLFAQVTHAYSKEAHQILTNEIVKFYNLHFPGQRISFSDASFLLQGSYDEDESPRWMNHFYDPIAKTGLRGFGDQWISAKQWARDDVRQLSLSYSVLNPYLFSVLQSDNFFDVSHTWESALRKYLRGDMEDAFLSLGRVLHLLEDMAVPAHTRNDPHPHLAVGGYDFGDPNPYEAWTSKFTPSTIDLSENLSGRMPVAFQGIDDYFDEIAGYSNKNFYSKDSIGIGSYSLPTPDYIKQDGRYFYGFKIDSEGKEYHLIAYRTRPGSLLWAMEGNLVLQDEQGDFVLQDYWSRLAPTAVQYGAGALNLFFSEADRIRISGDSREISPSTEDMPLLAQVAASVREMGKNGSTALRDVVSSLFSRSGEQYDEIILDGIGEDVFTDLSGNLSEAKPRTASYEARPRKDVYVSVEPIVLRRGEVLNESGSGFTAGGSVIMYFELPTGRSVEVPITADANGNFSTDYRIPDDSLLGIYSYYAKDETTGMVSDRVKYQILEQTTSAAEVERVRQEAVDESSQSVSEAKPRTSGQMCSFETRQAPSRKDVIINEVAWMGMIASASNEWVELRNLSGGEIDISGWQLIDANDDVHVVFGDEDKRKIIRSRIPASGFYLLERTDDDSVPGVTADFVYVGALSNSGSSSSEGLRLFDANCQLVDEVLANPDWPAGNASLRKTMERGDNLQWYDSQFTDGTPKQKNSTPPPSPSPPATSSGGDGGGGGSSPSPPPQPTATISTASQSLSYEQSTTISWSSANATSCSLKKGGVEAATGMSGSHTTPSLVADATYSISCIGSGGTVIKSVSVAVGPPPENQNTATSTPPGDPAPPLISWCVLNQSASPTHEVLLNEIAWAGTGSSSPLEEWMELYGQMPHSLDGWQLQDATGEIKIAFGANDSIQNSYFLLRRILTSDDPALTYFVGSVTADKTYTGILQNTDEALRLFDDQCVLVDEVIANIGVDKNWPGGEASPSYRTMERGMDLSWHTYGGNGINGIMGTPRTENGMPLATSTSTPEEVIDSTPPSVPSDITASFDLATSQITVSWRESVDPNGTVGYEMDVNGLGWSAVAASPVPDSADRLFVNMPAATGITYDIRVRAVDEAGNYSANAIVQFSPLAPSAVVEQADFSAVNDKQSRSNPIQSLGTGLSGTLDNIEIKYDGAANCNYTIQIYEYTSEAIWLANIVSERFFSTAGMPTGEKSCAGVGIKTDTFFASDFNLTYGAGVPVFFPDKFYAFQGVGWNANHRGSATDAYAGGMFCSKVADNKPTLCEQEVKDLYFALHGVTRQ